MQFDTGPEEEAFEDERERVDRPMYRLFVDYGSAYKGAFSVGLASSVFSRILDLLPPLLLAVAIDSIFRGEMAFSLWLVPQDWLPTSASAQLWLTAGIVAASFDVGAIFHYTRNWGGTASPSGSSTTSGRTPTTRCSA